MASAMAGDLRNGVTFELDGRVMSVMEFLHVKQARGAAVVRTKLRDVKTGAVLERTFNPSEKIELARIDKKNMTFCYSDGSLDYFMDQETFEQIPIDNSLTKEALQFVKEDIPCEVSFYQGQAFAVEAPNFVELKIVACEPGLKGNTATAATKPATLETGIVIDVPLFVNNGDTIKVDTRTKSYMSRV